MMKTVFDVIRHPLVIGALILSILIVVGVYFGSHWYYGDVEPVGILEVSAPTPPLPRNLSSSEVDLSGLQGESLLTQPESTGTVSSAEGESVDDFLAELSDEEKALLAAEVVEETQRVSPFGFGPYPELPPDWPRQNIWEELETAYHNGDGNIEHELINRVLVKLWKQGEKVDSGVMEDKKVFPLYSDTIYVRWEEDEDEDGTSFRYLGEILCLPELGHYEEDIENGIVPSGIKVVEQDDAGLVPYSFLDLP